jgi:GNAT superfamily N-acetyltransferase
MTEKITVIPYAPAYRDDMLFCYLSAKDAIGSYAPEGHRKPTLRDDLLDIERHYFQRGDIFYLAIDENDRVVGMVGTHTVSSGDLWLQRLFVKSGLKGRGIGSKLLAKVEAYAVEKDITTIHTRFVDWYREAASFYPAKGFVEALPDGSLRHMIKQIG